MFIVVADVRRANALNLNPPYDMCGQRFRLPFQLFTAMSSCSKIRRKLSIPFFLALAFVLPLLIVVVVVETLSYQSGQDAVDHLFGHLMVEVTKRVDLYLEQKFWLAQHINQVNVEAVERATEPARPSYGRALNVAPKERIPASFYRLVGPGG